MAFGPTFVADGMDVRIAGKHIFIAYAVPAGDNPMPFLQLESKWAGFGIEFFDNSRIMEFMSPNNGALLEKGIRIDAFHNRIAMTLRFGSQRYLEWKDPRHGIKTVWAPNPTAQKHQPTAFRINRQTRLDSGLDRFAKTFIGRKPFQMRFRKPSADIECIDGGQPGSLKAGNLLEYRSSVRKRFEIFRVVELKGGIPDYADFDRPSSVPFRLDTG